jgi:tRNA/rRNA methyltransferase
MSGIDLVIGTSAKRKSAHHDYHPASELPGIIEAKGNAIKRIALVFGREESGLSNNQLRLCDLVSYLPMKQPFPSLNLSQAVMLYAYILNEPESVEQQNGATQMQQDSYERSFASLKKKTSHLMEVMGLSNNINLSNRIMERLALLGEDDINLAHSLINAWLDTSERRDDR